MRILTTSLFALAVATVATPALADDAPAAAASPFTITGGATLTSDYRFRGISQTDKRFAIQGTLGVSHESGFYIGTWGSSIDDYIANGGDQEIDLYGGWKHTFSGTTLDTGLLYYYYPGSGGVNSDFFEPYANLSHSFGPIGAKIGANYSWKQHALTIGTKPREDNLYTYGELSFAVPNTGFAVTGHFGHTFGPSYLSIGKEYSDWSVTAAYTWKALTFSAAYVDASKDLYVGTRNETKGGFVGAVAVSF